MIKKIVVATTNKNKVERIKNLLQNDEYEVLSLTDIIKAEIEEPEEISENGIDNAMIKAGYYIDFVPEGTLVLSQDDTMALIGVSDEDDPKGHIKEPVRRKYGTFTDEYGILYYTELAKKYGGIIPLEFRYGHGLAIKSSLHGKIFKKVLGKTSLLKARMVSEAYKPEICPGYFLSSLMEVEINGRWVKYNDLSKEEIVLLDADLYDSILSMLKEIK